MASRYRPQMVKCSSCVYQCLASEGYRAGNRFFCGSCHRLWKRQEKEQIEIGRAKTSNAVGCCAQCDGVMPLFREESAKGAGSNMCRTCWDLEVYQARRASTAEQEQFLLKAPLAASCVSPAPYKYPFGQLNTHMLVMTFSTALIFPHIRPISTNSPLVR